MGPVKLVELSGRIDLEHSCALDRPARILTCAGALECVASSEDVEKEVRLAEGEARLAKGECRRDLLVVGKPGETLCQGDTEEPLGEKLGDLLPEPLQDLEPRLDPLRRFVEHSGKSRHREPFSEVKIAQCVEILGKGGFSGRVVAFEASDLGLDRGPGLDDGPDRWGLDFPQGEESLEAVDEQESPGLFDDDQGIVGVDLLGRVGDAEELGRYVSERDFSTTHGASSRCGSERT